MKPFGHRQLAFDLAKALGMMLGWAALWSGLFFVAGRLSGYTLAPLGIILAALLQKAMLELRLRAIDRQLLKHPRLNDGVGDWLFTRPFLARLSTERARLLVGEESAKELAKEEGDWTRILGPYLVVATGFQRLVLLDHQSKWAGRLRFRQRIPLLTVSDIARGVASVTFIFAFLLWTNAFFEFFLFGAVPYFFITPYWESRLLREFAEKRAKHLANWRRA